MLRIIAAVGLAVLAGALTAHWLVPGALPEILPGLGGLGGLTMYRYLRQSSGRPVR
jgi:hypothetical protein